MTLDEAIVHAEEQTELLEESARGCDLDDRVEKEIACKSGKCAAEHRQLAEWLKELREYKQQNVNDICVWKTNFKSGDKFILELGAEHRMFGKFEIAGTDLYVETRLLEKLKRYEPENKLDSAQPEPPRAYWIRGKYSWDDYHYNDTSYKCSRCGKVDANIPRYCPGCGAKMEEEIR